MICDSRTLIDELTKKLSTRKPKRNARKTMIRLLDSIDTSKTKEPVFLSIPNRTNYLSMYDSQHPHYSTTKMLGLEHENLHVESKKPKMLFNDIIYDSTSKFFKDDAIPLIKRICRVNNKTNDNNLKRFQKSHNFGFHKVKQTPFQMCQYKNNVYRKLVNDKQHLHSITGVDNEVLFPSVHLSVNTSPSISFRLNQTNSYRRPKDMKNRSYKRPINLSLSKLQCYYNKKNLMRTEETILSKNLVDNYRKI